jgi:hypothetical protein
MSGSLKGKIQEIINFWFFKDKFSFRSFFIMIISHCFEISEENNIFWSLTKVSIKVVTYSPGLIDTSDYFSPVSLTPVADMVPYYMVSPVLLIQTNIFRRLQ